MRLAPETTLDLFRLRGCQIAAALADVEPDAARMDAVLADMRDPELSAQLIELRAAIACFVEGARDAA